MALEPAGNPLQKFYHSKNQDDKQNDKNDESENNDVFTATLVFAFNVMLAHKFEVAGVGFEEEVENLSEDGNGTDGSIKQNVETHQHY